MADLECPLLDATEPSVSVVVPHYGSPAPATAMVRALQRQQTQRRLQLIVVDDASPEPFPELSGVTVVRRERNGGFGTAANTGAEFAEHPWLLVLNSDLEIDDYFVERLTAEAAPWMPAVVGPRIVDLAGNDAWSGRLFPTVTQQTTEWLVPLARWRSSPPLHRAVGHDTDCRAGEVRLVDWLVGAALLLPTEEFRTVGGFDEGYFMNSEEVDLQRRLRELRVPSVYIGTVVAAHEGGTSSDPRRRRRWLVSSRLRYAEKWGGLRRLQLALSAATMANLAWNAGRRLLGRPLQPLATAGFEFGLIWRKETQ